MTDTPGADLIGRLTEIRAREQKATRGPWEYERLGIHERARIADGPTDSHHVVDAEVAAKGPWEYSGREVCGLASTRGKYEREEANGIFIAHAREDVPWLLEQIESLTARLAEAEQRQLAHLNAVGQFLSDMYCTMIDPLSEGTADVTETCAALLKQAREDRESLAELDTLREQLRAAQDERNALSKELAARRTQLKTAERTIGLLEESATTLGSKWKETAARAESAERQLQEACGMIRELVEDCTCDFKDCEIHDAARRMLAALREPSK